MDMLLKPILIVYNLPNSMIGFAFGMVAIASGGSFQFREGCLEFHGGFIRWFLKNIPPWSKNAGMAAMTLGHVIIGQNTGMLARARAHEHVHVRQYEIWGPLFLPVYLGFSFLLWLSRRDPYLDNPFEVEAFGKVDHRRT